MFANHVIPNATNMLFWLWRMLAIVNLVCFFTRKFSKNCLPLRTALELVWRNI